MKKIAVFVVLILSLIYSVAFSEKIRFVDISSHWAKSVIEWGVQQGVAKGYPDGSFHPDQPVTEVEFMALLVRYFPNAASTSDQWSQSHVSNLWSDSVIEMAYHFQLPISQSPTHAISRGEVAQIISGALGYHYDDNGAIALLYDLGLSHGRTRETIAGYDAAGTLTRAEAVAFLKNMSEKGLGQEMKIMPNDQAWRVTVGHYTDPNILGLGDSITFGLNLNQVAGVPSEHAFPALMAANQMYRTINLGVPGWTTQNLLDALDTDRFKSAVNQAKVVTLDIGSNDLIQGSANLLAAFKQDPSYKPTEQEILTQVVSSESKVFDDLPLIIDKVRKLTDAPVVLYTLYNPFPNIDGIQYIHQLNEQILYPINQLIRDQAKPEKNVLLADAHLAFSGHEMNYVRVQSGDIHPTIEGQEELAKIGENALNRYLTRK
jgi:hypothetical protein